MYNCSTQIPRVIKSFTPDILPFIHTILIIDNRSTDESLNSARQALPTLDNVNWLLVRNVENYGLGGSQKVGFAYAIDHGFDHVILLHGDDQGDISDLLSFLQSGHHQHYDAVLGARFMRGSRLHNYSMLRTYGNIVFNRLFALVLQKKVYDLGSGLNLYKVETLKSGFYFLFPDDLTFNYAMVLAHAHLRHNIHFIPISWRENDQISNVKLFRQGRRVLRMLYRYFLKPHDFLGTDHREVARQAYPFEIIAEHHTHPSSGLQA